MQVVVPFAASTPKTRLGPVLDAAERATVSRAMLTDVLRAIEGAGKRPTVCATKSIDLDHRVIVDDRSLSSAVNAILEASDEPTAVVMADLPLATSTALQRLFAVERDVGIVPGRGGGTNALVVRHPDFRVDYHGASFRDHLEIARDVGATVETVDSFRLSTDVDEPDDLVEVLLHGGEATRDALSALGFELAVERGRVGVTRRTTPTSESD